MTNRNIMRKQNLDFNYNRRPNDNERRPVGKRNMISRLAKHGAGYKKKFRVYPCYIYLKPRNKFLLDVEELDYAYLSEAFEYPD